MIVLEEHLQGLLVIWNNATFKITNIECSKSWIALLGYFFEHDFHYVVVSIYVDCAVNERKPLYEELSLQKHDFDDLWILHSDLNETLLARERGRRRINCSGARDLDSFFVVCKKELPLLGCSNTVCA
jgi:hypothetical protein